MVIKLAAYMNGVYNGQRTTIVILFSAYINGYFIVQRKSLGGYTVQRTPLVIMWCSVHQW